MNLVKQNDNLSFRYSTLPSIILYEEPYKSMLSDKAKLLYIIILDRLKLSIKNNYTNDKNEVYIYLSRQEVQKILNCSDKTITKTFNELIFLDLIYEERTGIGKSIKIYVNKKDDIFTAYGKFTVINGKNTNVQSEILRTEDKRKNNFKISNYQQREYSQEFLESLYSNLKN